MCFGDMSCSFFKGKQSRKSFEVIKGDCTNVDGDVGEGGGFVKRKGGGEGRMPTLTGCSSWKRAGMIW
jgi:hypothetical protein